MFTCPHCSCRLVNTKTTLGIFWICSSCGGRAATVSLLRKTMPRVTVNTLWQTVRSGAYPEIRKCPACSHRMSEIPIAGKDSKLIIDACKTCQFVWFDPSEYEGMPQLRVAEPAPVETRLPIEARERLAIARINQIREDSNRIHDQSTTPDSALNYLTALFGFPVEYNDESSSKLPVATILLTAAIALISIVAFSDLKTIVYTYGLIPADPFRYYGATLITSFFLHGGIAHLVGNVYFLLIFGDNVEDTIGRWKFLALVFTATIAGDMLHILGDASSTIPCIGASGGISGVLAYYALKFPHARVGFLFFLVHIVKIPVVLWFAFWVVMQILGAAMHVDGMGGIAYLAHLGGAITGAIFWLLTKEDI